MCKEHDDRNLTTNLILPVVKALNVVHFHLLNVLLSFFVLYILLNQYVQFFPLYKPNFITKRKIIKIKKNIFDINNMTFLRRLFKVKKSELEIWSLQIFSFQRNSRSQLQLPLF
jgi:hypothetical protein